jgi:hypothetical protein
VDQVMGIVKQVFIPLFALELFGEY